MQNDTRSASVPAKESFSRLLLDLGLRCVRQYDAQCHFWNVYSKDLDDSVRSSGSSGKRFVDLELIPLGTRTPLGLIESCRWDGDAKRFVVSYREWNTRPAKDYSVTELRGHLKEIGIMGIRLGHVERNVVGAATDIFTSLYVCAADICSVLARPFRGLLEDDGDA